MRSFTAPAGKSGRKPISLLMERGAFGAISASCVSRFAGHLHRCGNALIQGKASIPSLRQRNEQRRRQQGVRKTVSRKPRFVSKSIWHIQSLLR